MQNSCTCRTLFDVDAKRIRISGLSKITSRADFWNDQKEASEIMKELEYLNEEITHVERLSQDSLDLKELIEITEDDVELVELQNNCKKLEEEIEALEFHTLLSGEYDQNDAIISIHAGAGGVDAQDWTEMLLRMYLRWAEKNNLKAHVALESRGSEAGIKSVTFEVTGRWAYGYLKGESGVHRLVRLSPFNSDNLRQTSFSLVEVLPIIDHIAEVEIADTDLKIDTFRASGAGGQSVNKTDSAVRITHEPTGIVVACQNERSQLQNKEQAMKILRAKLHQKYLDEKEIEKQKLRGNYKSAEWGSQIRSYVLHPYQLVKDHRTRHETTQTEKVLDGDLAGFTDAYLHWYSRDSNT